MTVFKGGEAIKEFLEEFDSWLSESVTVYLLGGSAMTVRGVNDPGSGDPGLVSVLGL